jgi:hypothetical protein
MLAAALFSRSAGAIESANSGLEFGKFWEDIQSNAIGSILASVAGLEAYINEIFVDHDKVFPDIRQDVMKELWKLYEQKKTLEKYDFALVLREGKRFDRGRSPYQDIAVLIDLRNALTHFKPEWGNEHNKHAKLSKAMKNKAARSPFFPDSEALFPRAWASHGTTRWAVDSVVSFVRDFEQLAGLPSRLALFE